MTALHQYIEDYILGKDLPHGIKGQIEDTIKQDVNFANEVERTRETITGLQLAGIKSRIKHASGPLEVPDDVPFEPRKINYLTWLLLAIVACALFIIYQKNKDKSRPADDKIEDVMDEQLPPLIEEKEVAPPLVEEKKNLLPPATSTTKKEAPAKKKTTPARERPDIKSASQHAAIAMNYFNRRLPLTTTNRGDENAAEQTSDEKALSICANFIQSYQYTEAKRCLTKNFGKREEDAEWYRALLALATEGKDAASSALNNIASNRLHIYSRQAKTLIDTLNN
jgi:hypothetical protein